jgi:hypothetical protein
MKLPDGIVDLGEKIRWIQYALRCRAYRLPSTASCLSMANQRLSSTPHPLLIRAPQQFGSAPTRLHAENACRQISESAHAAGIRRMYAGLSGTLTWEPHEEAKCSRTFVGRQNESMENTKNIS